MVFSHTEILSNIHQNGTTPQVLKTDQVNSEYSSITQVCGKITRLLFVVGS